MRVGSRRVAPRVSCGRRAAGASQRRRTVSRSVRSRRDPRTRVPGGVTDGGPAAIQPTCSKSSRGSPREHPGPDARSSSSAVRPGSAKELRGGRGWRSGPSRPVPGGCARGVRAGAVSRDREHGGPASSDAVARRRLSEGTPSERPARGGDPAGEALVSPLRPRSKPRAEGSPARWRVCPPPRHRRASSFRRGRIARVQRCTRPSDRRGPRGGPPYAFDTSMICSINNAFYTVTRSSLRSSSIREPSDPPFGVYLYHNDWFCEAGSPEEPGIVRPEASSREPLWVRTPRVTPSGRASDVSGRAPPAATLPRRSARARRDEGVRAASGLA